MKNDKQPKSLFQQGLNKINKNNKNSEDEIAEILKIILMKNTEHGGLNARIVLGLYEILDRDKYLEVMSLLSGKHIYFPTYTDITDDINLAVAYYLKEMHNKSWDEIKSILNDPDLDSVKLGIRNYQLKKFMTDKIFEQKG